MLVGILAERAMEKNLEDLKNRAKDEFGNTIFIPIEDLIIKNDKKIKFYKKNEEIKNLDILIPYPGKETKKFITALLAFESSDVYLPFGLRTFMNFERNSIGIGLLKNAEIETIECQNAISEKAIRPVLKVLDYPKRIRIGNNELVAKDKENAEEIITTRNPGNSIMIQDMKGEKLTGCWMVGDEMIASIEIVNNKPKITNTGTTINNIVSNALKALDSPYGYFVLDDEKIISFSLAPPLKTLENVTGKNTSAYMIKYLSNMLVPKEEKERHNS